MQAKYENIKQNYQNLWESDGDSLREAIDGSLEAFLQSSEGQRISGDICECFEGFSLKCSDHAGNVALGLSPQLS